ncbi:hypothetical protein PQX77_000732 [Marasmius sp. AFHP31]|nr:hypothetical protein PQX77_006097 [Marasmius sp. AFHP31]KAK1236018.1 hypothetical protein PQX77_000732 [Marasmius sp. AFHP31]
MKFLPVFGVILPLFTATALAQHLQVLLNPSGVPVRPDNEWLTWTVTNGQASASTTISGVKFTISAGSGTTLKGSQYKLIRNNFNGFLGQHMVGEGMSTDATTGIPLTLSIQGLSAGTHSLLSWHNAWDNLQTVTGVDVAVGGTKIVSNKAQSIRQDNLWTSASSFVTFNVTGTSQTITVTYTPVKTSGITDLRAFLNGFEVDPAGNVASQASFPFPENNDEHVNGDSGSITASWKGISGAKYDVYLGTAANSLSRVAQGQTGTSVSFSGLDSSKTYYWRVDVISGSTTTLGRTWMFRPRQLAFPGAEGYGKYARGGRGGKVVKVTTLADSGAGSLREAVEGATGPRTIVFDIGGVITLQSRLTLNQNYITVAGQTAPGKGIVITKWPFGLSGARDVIVRHMRVRPGKSSGATVDGMGMSGSNHAILDRCSMGWSIDEAFSSRTAFNISLQRSMISEPLNVAGHQNYPAGTAHGYAASIGGDIGSFHHNLIAHAEGRSWSMAGGLDEANNFAGRLDIRNNVVYNFGGRVTDGGAHQVNFVSNYYKPGPSSVINYDLQATYEDNFGGSQTYYCSGNSQLGKFDQNSAQVSNATSGNPTTACYAVVSFSPAPTYQKFYTSPFFDSFVETQTSTEAYKRVLSDTGAQTPSLDDHDKRIVTETKNNKPTYKGSVSGKSGLIDNEADVGGLESYPTTSRASNWDANNDGIADWWDGSTGGTGFTALDGYLNFMGDPHFFVEPSATATYDLTYFAAGFVNPTYTVSASKGTVSVSGNSLKYTATATGIDKVTVNIKDSEGSTWSRSLGVAIFTGASKA